MKVMYKLLIFLVFWFFGFYFGSLEALSQTTTQKKKIGVSKFFGTDINSDEIVEKLVEVEAEKGEKYMKEVSNETIKKAIILFLNRNLKDLSDIAKSIYDYRSPFGSRVGISSDEGIMVIEPNRGAEISEYRIVVEKIAKPDSFISDPVPRDTSIGPIKFRISVGDKSYELDFNGGSMEDLAKYISDSVDLVDAKVINVDNERIVLKIEGKKTGNRMKIMVDGEISELLRIGLLKKNQPVTQKSINVLNLFGIGDFTVGPREIFSREVKFAISGDTYLEISGRTLFMDVPKPKDVEIRVMDPVKVSNVIVRGGSLIGSLEIFKTYISNDFEFVVIEFTDGSKTNIAFEGGETSIRLNNHTNKTIDKIILRNGNDTVKVTFSKIMLIERVEDKSILANYIPKNYISKAENAVVYIDGVRIEREDNEITNIINGKVKLLSENSNKIVTAKVDYDYKLITNSISNLVEKYNDIMMYLSKLTKPIVDNRMLVDKPDEEKEEGAFATDMDFIRLKDKLRTFAMQPYQTRSTNIKLLYHVGIYTKKIETKLDLQSDMWEYVRRGILEFDTEKFVSAVNENIDAVRDIFAYDKDKNKIVDSGFAFEIANILDNYTSVSGIISLKMKQIDNRIKSNKEQYAKFQEHLEKYRASLEDKFGRMQQILRESKSKQEWMKNQMKAISGQ